MSNTAPRLLLVEDDLDALTLMRETLCDHFGSDCTEHFDTVGAALSADLNLFDLVISDMNLPDGSGLELLQSFLARRADLPFVLVTGEGILENAIEAIQIGAYDYVVKAGDYLFSLPVVVEKNLAIYRTRQENERLKAELERTVDQVKIKNQQLEQMVDRLETMAATDPLTGLANRRSFGQALERRFADAQRQGHDLACLMIDLDGFKQVNDSLGHPVGDRILQIAAEVLKATCRRSDVAGRFGGDEFVLLLPMAERETAAQIANRIRSDFEARCRAELRQVHGESELSMSVGLSLKHTTGAESPQQLITFADEALYIAKQSGKRCLVVYPGEIYPSVKQAG